MNLTLTVLEIVAPVFLLAGIGFGWVKLGFEYRIEFVTQLAMTLSVPCLIFVSLMNTEIDPAALTALSLAIWSFTFGIWLVAGAGSFGKVLREALVWATLLGPCLCGKTGRRLGF